MNDYRDESPAMNPNWQGASRVKTPSLVERLDALEQTMREQIERAAHLEKQLAETNMVLKHLNQFIGSNL